MSFCGEVITSSQNKYISLTRSLEDRKHREKNRLFRFDGIKLMCEAIKRGEQLEFIAVRQSAYESVFEKAESLYGLSAEDAGCRILTVSDSVFDKLSGENAPEGVISVARYNGEKHREYGGGESLAVVDGEKILVLESVRDPQNVGAIMRVAAAFGVDRVIMGRDCADIYSSKTVRASMGAIFSLRIDRVQSVPDAVRALGDSGRRVFAAALDENAHKLGELVIESGDCVVIGNEGHGISTQTADACFASVYIPMTDGVESLNAATAAAVLAWEFFG